MNIEKLVDAPKLLEILFDKSSRPSTRWLRKMQKSRTISFVKIGHFVRFDVEKVRAELDRKNTVKAKGSK
jgi:hypothetical protein